jgi:hypothetical protein
VAFDPSQTTTTSNGQGDITVNYAVSGAGVPPGQNTHVGATLTSNTDVGIVGVTLTSNGTPIGQISLPSTTCIGDATQWTVARTDLYTDQTGTTPVGTHWSECQGTAINISNRGHGKFCGKTATMNAGTTQVPLTSLNQNLNLPPSTGPITCFPQAATAPALPVVAVLALGAGMLGVGVKRMRSRRMAAR